MELEKLARGLESKIKELFLNSVPRYYDHTMKVVSNMKEIIKGGNIGEEQASILTAAAFLHDIGYSAPYGDNYVGNIEDQSVKIPAHCETGVDISKKVLSELGVEQKIAEQVIHLVSIHHGAPDADDNLKLLLQADNV